MSDENPKLKSQLTPSLGVSALLNFYASHSFPVAELERFENEFEASGHYKEGTLWTAKLGRTEDEIRVLNVLVMDWVWHFRDFFWEYAQANLDLKQHEAQALTKAVVDQSEALQLCGHFTTERKHKVVRDFKPYPLLDKSNPPRLGPVRIRYLLSEKRAFMEANLEGAATLKSSNAFPFVQTVLIEGLSTERDTRCVAEEAAWEWIDLLKAHGVDIGVTKPQLREIPDRIDHIQFGEIPYFALPDGGIGVRVTMLDYYTGLFITAPTLGVGFNLRGFNVEFWNACGPFD
jgi:hypothetical protein